jgi:hypothetical protein
MFKGVWIMNFIIVNPIRRNNLCTRRTTATKSNECYYNAATSKSIVRIIKPLVLGLLLEIVEGSVLLYFVMGGHQRIVSSLKSQIHQKGAISDVRQASDSHHPWKAHTVHQFTTDYRT